MLQNWTIDGESGSLYFTNTPRIWYPVQLRSETIIVSLARRGTRGGHLQPPPIGGCWLCPSRGRDV